MKRYLVFTAFDYSADGGLKDFYCDADTIDEALAPFCEDEDTAGYIAYKNLTENEYVSIDEVHILDTQTGEKYFIRGYKELEEFKLNHVK